MEIANREMVVIEKTVDEKGREAQVQLTDLQLAYVGGGIGDVVFG